MAMAGDPPQHVLPVLACDKHALNKGARAAIPLPLQRHGGYCDAVTERVRWPVPLPVSAVRHPFRSSCAV